MMFGLQGPELLLILLLVLIVFGAGKLPQVFNSLGKGIKEFREAADGKESTPETPPTTPPTTATAATTTTAPPPATTSTQETTVTHASTGPQDSTKTTGQ